MIIVEKMRQKWLEEEKVAKNERKYIKLANYLFDLSNTLNVLLAFLLNKYYFGLLLLPRAQVRLKITESDLLNF